MITNRGEAWHETDAFRTIKFIAVDRKRVFSFDQLLRIGLVEQKDSICFGRVAMGMFSESIESYRSRHDEATEKLCFAYIQANAQVLQKI